MVWDRQYLEYSEQKDDSISELMNDKGVYITAPATPGLLNILLNILLITGEWFLREISKRNFLVTMEKLRKKHTWKFTKGEEQPNII